MARKPAVLRQLGTELRSLAPNMRVPARGEAARLAERNEARPNWYHTKRWKDLKREAHRRDDWQCVQTGASLTEALPLRWNSATADHIIPHHWDPALFWDLDNVQSVTKEWHDTFKQSEEKGGRRASMRPEWIRPASIPAVLVCGPPASGKTRLVAMLADPSDVVIDLDAIVSKVSGQPITHQWDRTRWLQGAIWARNAMIGRLCDEQPTARNAWVIMTAPKPSERRWWTDKIGAVHSIVIEASEFECNKFANMDEDRDQAHTASAVWQWWTDYERLEGDEPMTIDQINEWAGRGVAHGEGGVQSRLNSLFAHTRTPVIERFFSCGK